MPTSKPPQPAAPGYPSDMTEEEWRVLQPLIPPAKAGGRPRGVDMRAVINGIFYVLRSGGAWRMLPHDFPPWPTVYYYFWRWRGDGTWERLQDSLRTRVRERAGREASPRNLAGNPVFRRMAPGWSPYEVAVRLRRGPRSRSRPSVRGGS